MTGTVGMALRCSDLSIGYRLKKESVRTVASGLNLELERGRFVCLLGPNGAGKSTLIRALSGLEAPLSGSVEIEGEALSALAPKERARRISVVLTESVPLGLFTADAVVALGRHPHTNWTGRLTADDRESVNWALRAVGAEALRDRMIGELSDGERQKVMIARALAQEAKVMFLDEPTAYLDLPRRVELMQTLRRLSREEGLSIVLSTHDLELALRCADELWLFDGEGRVTTGMPEALALGGSIAEAFASSNLDWDAESGAFRLHREPCALAWIDGYGPAAAWTRRALERIGYGMSESAEGARVRVRIGEAGDGVYWDVEDERGARRCGGLAELVRVLIR